MESSVKHLKLSVGEIKIINRGSLQNARTVFNSERMKSLRTSICAQGLLYPLIVRKLNNEYLLLGGERRLRSIYKLLEDGESCYSQQHQKKLPAKEVFANVDVKCFECDDMTALGIAYSDNLERVDLTEIERIEACMRLDNETNEKGEKAFTRDQIAGIFDTSPSWVSQTISIGNLPRYALEALNSGIINRSSALQLLKTNSSKIKSVIDFARNLVEKDYANRLQSAIDQVETLKEKVEQAQTDVEVAEVMVKRAPLSRKAEASGILKKSTEVLKSTSSDLSTAKERMAALNKASGNKTITADVIGEVNETLGARTGKGRPLSTKQIRDIRSDLETKIKGVKQKTLKRDYFVMLSLLQLVLRESDLEDHEAIPSVADKKFR
jgi:ParB family chromosome partitioning protein